MLCVCSSAGAGREDGAPPLTGPGPLLVLCGDMLCLCGSAGAGREDGAPRLTGPGPLLCGGMLFVCGAGAGTTGAGREDGARNG